MNDRRGFQRYAVIDDRDILAGSKITIEGELVRLVDFSLGGLSVLSKKPFSIGNKKISVEFQDRGRIELIGVIVWMRKEGRMWRVAIELTETYKLNALRKV